jgi:peptidoglycan/xylan/chitin deacetylase (PgdA/CDA1 family)
LLLVKKSDDKLNFKEKSLFKFIVLMLFSTVVSANSCVVLLYHHFSDSTPKSTSISPKLFEKHLQFLQDNDFNVLPLKAMLEGLKQNNLPDKCVALTADDAYKSIAKNAYPLLQKYQMSMSVFVSSNSVDKKYKAMMSWDTMRDIQGENIAFYNHSKTHTHLLDLTQDQIKAEIEHSQNRLKIELGVVDKIFAYPYGEANIDTMQLLKNMGYTAFGQHSGVVFNQADWQNFSRFPMAAHYAKMKSFKLKINTVPMPIVFQRINTVVDKNNIPILSLKFIQPLTKKQKHRFNCFTNGGVDLTWKDNQNVQIVAKKQLSQRRNKYNCTMPYFKDNKYHWYSVQWVNPKIKE